MALALVGLRGGLPRTVAMQVRALGIHTPLL